MSEYRKRSGSTLREYNINVVIEKLRQGMNETDVLNELAMAFCPDTRIDYLNTAKEKLKMEKSETSIPQNNAISTEEKQTKVEQKEKEDFTLDLTEWINSNHYEKLSDSELIEKISMLKNEKLKTNWISQIKESSESS